jgi:uncharacterized membrane protein
VSQHLRPILLGLLLLGLISLVPDLTPPASGTPPVDVLHGRIVELLPTSDNPAAPNARVEIVEGVRAGSVLEAHLEGPSGAGDVPAYHVGDDVLVSVSDSPDAPDASFVAVSDRWRVPALAAIVGIFALAVTIVGGWRGIRSLIALVLSLAVLVRIVIPLLLAGWPPVPVAVVMAALVTAATLVLTEGIRRTTLAALAGTGLALALTAVLAVAANALAAFTQVQGQDAIVYLAAVGRADLDAGGLLLAAVIFGALGVLDDVTISQAATVHELALADPASSRGSLFRRAMNVGRSHMAATVNTLVLAYVGASLPLLILFAAGRGDPLLVASGEEVAVEIVQAVVGSIGIVAAVPLTTWMATLLVRPASAAGLGHA